MTWTDEKIQRARGLATEMAELLKEFSSHFYDFP